MKKAISLALAVVACAAAAAFAAKPEASRKFVFPAKSVGKTFVFPAKPIGRLLKISAQSSMNWGDEGAAAGTKTEDAGFFMGLHPDAGRVHDPKFWNLVPANIDGLDLSHMELTSAELKSILARFKNLRWLNITDTECDDTVFDAIGALSQMRILLCGTIDITGKGFEQLKKLPELTVLNIADTPVRPEAFKTISQLQGLLEIRASNTTADDAACAEFAKLPKLKNLNIGKTSITDKGIAALYPLHDTLEYLNVEQIDLTDDGLKHIGKLDKVSVMTLRRRHAPPYSAKGIRNLRGAKSLRNLDLSNSEVKDDVVQALPDGCPTLQALSILGCKNLTDAGIASVGKMPVLMNLNAEDTKLGDKTLQSLVHAKYLSDLRIGNAKITDAGLNALAADAPGLTALDVSNCAKITDKGVVNLWKMPKLQMLSLLGDEVTDASIPALSKMTKLKELALSHTKVTTDGIAKLKKALPGCVIRYDGH